MTFAEKLKTLRKQKNLTQIELAAKAGVSFSIIGQIECGVRNPSKDVATKLADFFNVELDTFIVESSDIIEKNTENKTVSMDKILMIADVVKEYFDKHGYTLTPEQRVALVDHFYHENIITEDEIKKLLSLMHALNFKEK